MGVWKPLRNEYDDWWPVTEREWLIPAAAVICPVLGFGSAFASLAIRSRLIASCEPFAGADTGPGEGWYVLLVLGPLITAAAFAAVSITFGATAYAWGRRRPWIPLAASALIAIITIYLAVLALDVPGHTPDCPTGRPAWWPGWLPL